MKLTKDRLKQIIKEELEEMLGAGEGAVSVKRDNLINGLQKSKIQNFEHFLQQVQMDNTPVYFVRQGQTDRGSIIKFDRSGNPNAPSVLFNMPFDAWERLSNYIGG